MSDESNQNDQMDRMADGTPMLSFPSMQKEKLYTQTETGEYVEAGNDPQEPPSEPEKPEESESKSIYVN